MLLTGNPLKMSFSWFWLVESYVSIDYKACELTSGRTDIVQFLRKGTLKKCHKYAPKDFTAVNKPSREDSAPAV